MGRHKDPAKKNHWYQTLNYKPMEVGSQGKLILLAISKLNKIRKPVHTTTIVHMLNKCTGRNFHERVVAPGLKQLVKKHILIEEKKLVKWGNDPNGRPRTHYQLTRKGRKVTQKVKQDFYRLYNGFGIGE